MTKGLKEEATVCAHCGKKGVTTMSLKIPGREESPTVCQPCMEKALDQVKGRVAQQAIPGTGQEKNQRVENAAHRLCDAKHERKRAGERVKAAEDALVVAMRAADLTEYRKGGIEIVLDEVEKVKVKRIGEEGSGVS